MNAITIIEHAPATQSFAAWVQDMLELFHNRRQTEWRIADGLRIGRERFADEPQMQMLLDQIGLDRKEADEMAKVARLIPDAWRSDNVSFEVCKQIAKIEDESVRQNMIKQAVDERWNTKTAHHAVVGHKVETGQLFEDEDATSRFATEFFRLWNRMPIEAREYAFPLLEISAASGFGPIDEDAAI